MLRMRWRTTAVVLTITMLVALPATASFARVEQPVPIKGNALTEDAMLPPDDCPGEWGWAYSAVGSGRFSHLGAVDLELHHCSRMTSSAPPLTGEFDHGITTVTAANGDILLLAQRGTFELELGPAGPILSHITLDWEAIGGTGRFAGATGSGTASGIGDLLTGTTTASYVGTIVYDASNRAAR
jgi:hypothetical protein